MARKSRSQKSKKPMTVKMGRRFFRFEILSEFVIIGHRYDGSTEIFVSEKLKKLEDFYFACQISVFSMKNGSFDVLLYDATFNPYSLCKDNRLGAIRLNIKKCRVYFLFDSNYCTDVIFKRLDRTHSENIISKHMTEISRESLSVMEYEHQINFLIDEGVCDYNDLSLNIKIDEIEKDKISSGGGIYKISINNSYYYGRSSNLYKRRKDHLKDLSRNAHINKKMQKSFNEAKESFEFVVVEEIDSMVDQVKAEKALLDKHYGKPNCLNLTKSAGGANLKHGISICKFCGVNSSSEEIKIFHNDLCDENPDFEENKFLRLLSMKGNENEEFVRFSRLTFVENLKNEMIHFKRGSESFYFPKSMIFFREMKVVNGKKVYAIFTYKKFLKSMDIFFNEGMIHDANSVTEKKRLYVENMKRAQ